MAIHLIVSRQFSQQHEYQPNGGQGTMNVFRCYPLGTLNVCQNVLSTKKISLLHLHSKYTGLIKKAFKKQNYSTKMTEYQSLMAEHML